MKEGYKDSVIGEIPLDWDAMRIGEVIEEYQNGYAFSPKGYLPEGIPIISMAMISLRGRFQFDETKCKYWDLNDEKILMRYLLKKGDLIMAMTDVTPNKDLIGKMALIDRAGKYFLNQRVGHLKVNAEIIHSQYLAYIGNSENWVNNCRNIASQGAQANIGTKQIVESYIPVPPLPEQRKIAEILSTVDDKIDVIDQQISETQALKKGLMQRLLTKGIGHTEFKDSPLGEIPKSWKVVKFSELISKGIITKIQDGNHGGAHPVTDDFVEEGIPFIMANCISTSNKLNLNKAKRISFNQYKSLRIGFSEPNDVLLTHKGTVGLTAIVEERHGSLMLTPQVTYYRIGDESILNRKFLYYYFQSSTFQHLIDKFSKQSTRAYIGITNQKNLLITLPNDSIEQLKISSILSSVDEKLEVLSDKKTHYQELKQGLMQQLLTGKIRVNGLINKPTMA